jgi:hypothetical protein
MKHAGIAALDRLEPLLTRLRRIAGLKERRRGVFYLKSRAFLHFHEDPAGLFADLRAADGRGFDRFQVDAPPDQDSLVAAAAERIQASSGDMAARLQAM